MRTPLIYRKGIFFGLLLSFLGMIISACGLFREQTIVIEAERFSERGGWVIDQQSYDQIGSSYLMAHGNGIPVEDARTLISIKKKGCYHIWVRTRNWAPGPSPESSAGRFRIMVRGKELPPVFGQDKEAWHWHYGGKVCLPDSSIEIRLIDLTGFNARCDAIIFSTNRKLILHEEEDPLLSIRHAGIFSDTPSVEMGPFDLVVVGGGVAGMSASLTAARLGLKVALLQNRPVLGGNNSSEIRVHMASDLNVAPYPNLGNITREIDRLNPEKKRGDFLVYTSRTDSLKAALLSNEPNLTLLTGMHVFEADTINGQIQAVRARSINSNREILIRGSLFADCTGDGNLGYLAGADHRYGRESKQETGEPDATDQPDSLVLGATLHWVAVEQEGISQFPLVPWAHAFNHESCQDAARGAWNWETGFQYDMVKETEFIRDNMLRAIFGNWSYQKNHQPFKEKYARHSIKWVAYVLGKRESRRLLGDVIYSQHELIDDPGYEDACVTSRWGIDQHFPDPENSKYFPRLEFRSVADHPLKNVHPARSLPYRCFYSRNIGNLFMAGRCASMTHLAHAMFRNQHTTGMMGEVVGMAAATAIRHHTSPREVYEEYWDELKGLLISGL